MNEQQGWMTLQTTLKSMGFDPGPIDGIAGPRTMAAALAAVQAMATRAVSQATVQASRVHPLLLVGGGLAVGAVAHAMLANKRRAA